MPTAKLKDVELDYEETGAGFPLVWSQPLQPARGGVPRRRRARALGGVDGMRGRR